MIYSMQDSVTQASTWSIFHQIFKPGGFTSPGIKRIIFEIKRIIFELKRILK
jgi:hypothetical protein